DESHFRDVVGLVRAIYDVAVAADKIRAGDTAAAAPLLERARALAVPRDAKVHREHSDIRMGRVFLRGILARHADLFASAACRVDLGEDGRWFRREGGPGVACAQRPVLRKLLVVLARARLETPGRAVRIERLIESCWPGQRMLAASARRRLQVAVSRLRELGL